MFCGVTGNRQSISGNSSKRTGHGVRTSPRSPVPSAFESLDGSDNDNSPSDTKLEDAYMDPNRDAVSLVQNL